MAGLALMGMDRAEADPYYPVGADCILYHAYWDGTALDHSSRGHNGTVSGASFVLNGLSFSNVADRVVIADSVDFDLSALSVYAWISSDPAIGPWAHIISQGHGNFWALMNNSTSRLATLNIQAHLAGPDTAYASNVWQLVCAAWDGATIDYFLNGSPTETKNEVGTINPADPFDVWVGNDPQYPELQPWKGLIGEVLLFNTEKTPAQALDYYNTTKARYGL